MRWNLDPVVLAALVVLLFAVRKSRLGQGAALVLFIAFVSPLCALSSALFSARVVHHILLIALAAPLLAMVWPARRPQQPVLLFAFATVVLWVWHLPALYDLALSNVLVYWIMQLSLIVSAFVFWRAVLAQQNSAVHNVILILAAYMQMGFLGAILTFASEPLYAAHAWGPYAWALTPLSDQQLGGLIMWVPAGLPYAVFGTLLARRAWHNIDHELA
ncbi:cytochrome c oxidase assembly protein [Litorimonas haliclonae]|uniref:cytochrome c oxidase assembly protein n=1 Tax=Litorimonas haliclonae TaxID=2081977 RepID=UPI0039EED483